MSLSEYHTFFVILVAEFVVGLLFAFWLRYEPERIQATKESLSYFNSHYDKVEVKAERNDD